jgi:transposase
MESIVPPLSPAVWEATPPESQALIVALQAEVSELRTRLGQDSSNSSRPPSSDLPQASAKAKAQRQRTPSERKRGGQPGHSGRFRAVLPLEQVTHVVVVAPDACRLCGQTFPLRWRVVQPARGGIRWWTWRCSPSR